MKKFFSFLLWCAGAWFVLLGWSAAAGVEVHTLSDLFHVALGLILPVTVLGIGWDIFAEHPLGDLVGMSAFISIAGILVAPILWHSIGVSAELLHLSDFEKFFQGVPTDGTPAAVGYSSGFVYLFFVLIRSGYRAKCHPH